MPVIRNAQDLNLLGIARGDRRHRASARARRSSCPTTSRAARSRSRTRAASARSTGRRSSASRRSAILGTYALVKRPWVVQDELGQDVIAIRPIMNITLTYDHRLVDGAYAAASCATCASGSRAGSRPTSGPERSRRLPVEPAGRARAARPARPRSRAVRSRRASARSPRRSTVSIRRKPARFARQACSRLSAVAIPSAARLATHAGEQVLGDSRLARERRQPGPADHVVRRRARRATGRAGRRARRPSPRATRRTAARSAPRSPPARRGASPRGRRRPPPRGRVAPRGSRSRPPAAARGSSRRRGRDRGTTGHSRESTPKPRRSTKRRALGIVLAQPSDQRAVPRAPRVLGQRARGRPFPPRPGAGQGARGPWRRAHRRRSSSSRPRVPTAVPSSEASRNTVAGARRELVLERRHARLRAPGATSLPIARNVVELGSCVRAGATSIAVNYPPLVSTRSLSPRRRPRPVPGGARAAAVARGAVSQGAIPETIVLLEHPPVITTGRRTEEAKELHIPEGADVELVETDRGGKSTYHAPGQLVCYPILDLTRHGKDVKRYVRDLEQAIVQTRRRVRPRGDDDRGADGRLDAAGRLARARARSRRSGSASRAG